MSASLLDDETLNAREILNVVILYDDRASRDHVLRIRDHLSEHFGGELEFACSWWKFEFLADEHLAAAASREVQGADVVLLAIHSSAALPEYVERWVKTAVATPSGRGAGRRRLVALLGTEDMETELGPIDAFLTRVTEQAGLDYLGASAVAVVPSELARRSISHRAYAHTNVMDDILNFRPPPERPRWGINE